jgi:hypothetical protein
MEKQLRQHERVDSRNLLYLCVRENEETIQQGMGRTLNVSESGIRLETHFPIDDQPIVWMTIGFEDDVVDIKGKIEYSIVKRNTYEFGIRFMEMDDRSRMILKEFVRFFQTTENTWKYKQED